MSRRRNNLTDIEWQEKTSAVTDFETALNHFIRDCRIRNLSDHTLIYYTRELNLFRKMLEDQAIDTNPNVVTKKQIEDNVIFYMLEDLHNKEVTVNTRLRAIRAFFNFLERKELVGQNPFKDIKLIRHKRRVIQTFSKQQVQLLLSQPNRSTFTGVRDLTIMMFLLETGVRAKECVSIDMSDIKFTDNHVRIKEPKGTMERTVPIQRKMKKQLQQYISLRGHLEDTDALFVTIDNVRLSKRQLQGLITKYGKSAGITNARCSPHTFRHTMAKLSVQGGADVFTLQAILGHSSLDMVRIYVNLFSPEIYENHKKFSPIERL